MKTRRIVVLAVAAIILAVLSTGTTLAASYTGKQSSELGSGTSPIWTETISQQLNTQNQDSLTWTNKWYNTHPGWTVNVRVPYSGTGLSWVNYQYNNLNYGRYHEGPISPVVTLDPGSTIYSINTNHVYDYQGVGYGTSFTTGMKYKVV